MISVPHEDLSYAFEINDINQHLFTWSPMSFGNLVQKSGFQISNVTIQKIYSPFCKFHLYHIWTNWI